MQYIPNMIFWLRASQASAAVTDAIALILFIFCLVGVGIFAGRVFNTKWSLSWRHYLAGFIISFVIATFVSILGAIYSGMTHVKTVVVSATGRAVVQEDCTKFLTDNNRLMEAAFREGVKNIVTSGVDAESLDVDTTQFVIPGESDAARRTNKELFIAGVAKVIAKGEPVKKGTKKTSKAKIQCLSDSVPFVYGFEPVSRDTDGSLYSKFEESMQGRESQPISVEDPFWYNALSSVIVEKSLKNLIGSVCKDLDSQRTSLLIVLVILVILQAVLIAILAVKDINPRPASRAENF